MRRRRTSLWKGIIGAVILLALAAGSIYLSWILSNPEIKPQPDTGSNPPNQVQTSAPQKDPVIKTEPKPEPTTQTDTDTETTSESTPTSTTTNSNPVQDIPLQDILGQISIPEGTPKRIAFTFDDGPYGNVTRQIADEFAKYGGKCTFFVVGNRIHGDWKAAMKYASDMGNEIGIHGYTHTAYFNKCNQATYLYEVQTTATAIEEATGKAPTLLRPPGGSITNLRVAESPYSIILWNVDTKDWQYRNADTVARNILTSTTPGDIILMHDIYPSTLEAIKLALPLLAEQGYEFVTVSELLGDEMQPGKKYNKAY
ncbi:MAG: polysaccharide deacetylase family protein [Clostridia bacterium]|nr:polysaccharide deacetylase family protein [Clostridia bacterium]